MHKSHQNIESHMFGLFNGHVYVGIPEREEARE